MSNCSRCGGTLDSAWRCHRCQYNNAPYRGDSSSAMPNNPPAGTPNAVEEARENVLSAGALDSDVDAYTTLGSRGHLFLTFTGLQLDQKDTQSQAGGISEMYERFGTYCKSFTSVMMMPSAVRVSMMNSKHSRLHHSIDWPRAVPCIVPERYKKVTGGAA